MKIGISLKYSDGDAVTGARFLDAIRAVEESGFSGIWFFDAIGRGFYDADPLGAACAAAAVTRDIEIGTCILQVPLRHPVELAHRIITTQLFSQGRFRFGVGAGSTKTDFNAVGGDFDNRFRQLREALPVMQALWRGETVNGTDLTPWPAARGGPPIYIGSWAGSRWIPIAAQHYDGWIASARFTDLATLRDGLIRFKQLGGKRAIVTNIQVDLDAATQPLGDDDKIELCCDPKTASSRLRQLAEIGFDDAVLVVRNHQASNLDAIRELF